MSIQFQYNKTALQQLNKQLKVRERALPTLKNKESALRIEVKRAKTQADMLKEKMEKAIQQYEGMVAIWGEFPQGLVSIEDVDLSVKKIAGVKTPVLNEVKFKIKPFSIFNAPKWFYDGIEILKKLAQISLEKETFMVKMQLLEHARKKTTQKVNLFEKVQIPGYQDAIRKIKRFLEDEENLSKSAQKIVKNRQQQTEGAQ